MQRILEFVVVLEICFHAPFVIDQDETRLLVWLSASKLWLRFPRNCILSVQKLQEKIITARVATVSASYLPQEGEDNSASSSVKVSVTAALRKRMYFHIVIYKYHHSTKLYRKISRVCCRLYCYECAARVTMPTAMKASDIFPVQLGTMVIVIYHTNLQFHCTFRRSARDLQYVIRILA